MSGADTGAAPRTETNGESELESDGSERPGGGVVEWSRVRESVASGLRDTRGAAQQVGFIMILGVLILATVTGAVFGVGVLEDIQGEGSFQQAESELSTIRAQHYEIAGGAPFRSEEVSLSGGEVGYGDNVTVSYLVERPGESDVTGTFETREVTYEAGDERLVYANGAVFRENTQEGTAVMKTEPQLGTSGSSDLIIPYLNVTRVGGMSSFGTGGAGTTSVYFTSYQFGRSVDAFAPTDADGNPQQVTVTTTIQSERWEQWELYFRDNADYSNVQTDASNNEVSAELTGEEIVITRPRIHVQWTQETGV